MSKNKKEINHHLEVNESAIDTWEQLKLRREQEILSDFSPQEQAIIREKQKRLSVLAQFIGKDFKMPVELNEPGKGWHWDFKNNIVRIDPRDLLEKPFDYLRFVISHEGGHRRISRTDFIPEDVWQRPGFSFMMNAVEDPRDNNFVADSYPQFAEQMDLAYQEDLDLEEKVSVRAREIMGRQPRFMQAGFELIKQWYKEVKNEPEAISKDLPDEVRQAVAKVLSSARDSWWTYPLKTDNEREIRRYAQASYEINLEKIWPEFSKLVELDLEDQKTQELLDELKKRKGERPDDGQDGGLPQDFEDQLTPKEQKQLEQALDEAMGSEGKDDAMSEGEENTEKPANEGQEGVSKSGKSGKSDKESKTTSDDEKGSDKQGEESSGESEKQSEKAGRRVDMDKLPEKLKQKIKKYLQSLPEEKQKELEEKAQQSLKDAEAEAGEAIKGKFESAQKKAEDAQQENQEQDDKSESEPSQESSEERNEKTKKETGEGVVKKEEKAELKKKREINPEEDRARKEALAKMREHIEKVLDGDNSEYEKKRHELLPLIKLLEDELRQVFTERAKNKLLTGFKSGRKIDIVKRIQEKAKGVLTMDSKAWQRREAPGPRDYAFTLLVDLSGSMRNSGKIEETFKATIVLAEVLNRLGIKTEILGFNDRLHQYQAFGQYFDSGCRAKIGTMLKEVNSSRAEYNDDGWALLSAAERLAQEREQEKFLLVFSDGAPEESPQHSGSEFDLSSVIKSLEQEKKVKLIGLGIGSDTKHVNKFYPNSLADIPVEHLAENLAGVIKDAVANYDHFR